MKKVKSKELDFLYVNKEEQKNKKRKEKNKTKNKKSEKKKEQKEELFNFDNEIVIGIKKEPKKNNKTSTKKNKKSNKQKKKVKQQKTKTNKEQNKKESPQTIKKKKRMMFFLKCMILITLLAGIALFLLVSPLFNILEIKVQNNEKISSEEIIRLSEIKEGNNLFRISSLSVENKVKQNPYIESVQLQRELPSTIKLVVKERKATYALPVEDNQFAYINNQGYILEINEDLMDLTQITSYKTENITPGARLNNEDLEKLGTVLKIMETAKGNQMDSLITSIDIKEKKNIILRLESEKKTIYIGDGSDINTKMVYIKATLEDQKGIEGELFMDGKTNKEGEFLFREKV